MPIRKADAEWKGNLIEGSGRVIRVSSRQATVTPPVGTKYVKARIPVQRSEFVMFPF